MTYIEFASLSRIVLGSCAKHRLVKNDESRKIGSEMVHSNRSFVIEKI